MAYEGLSYWERPPMEVSDPPGTALTPVSNIHSSSVAGMNFVPCNHDNGDTLVTWTVASTSAPDARTLNVGWCNEDDLVSDSGVVTNHRVLVEPSGSPFGFVFSSMHRESMDDPIYLMWGVRRCDDSVTLTYHSSFPSPSQKGWWGNWCYKSTDEGETWTHVSTFDSPGPPDPPPPFPNFGGGNAAMSVPTVIGDTWVVAMQHRQIANSVNNGGATVWAGHPETGWSRLGSDTHTDTGESLYVPIGWPGNITRTTALDGTSKLRWNCVVGGDRMRYFVGDTSKLSQTASILVTDLFGGAFVEMWDLDTGEADVEGWLSEHPDDRDGGRGLFTPTESFPGEILTANEFDSWSANYAHQPTPAQGTYPSRFFSLRDHIIWNIGPSILAFDYEDSCTPPKSLHVPHPTWAYGDRPDWFTANWLAVERWVSTVNTASKCQLHIPRKHDPTPKGAKTNYNAVRRWVDSDCLCCATADKHELPVPSDRWTHRDYMLRLMRWVDFVRLNCGN